MDWIKNNRFLAGFCATLIVGGLLLGAFLLMGLKGYKASKTEFEDTANNLDRLERKKIFPNAEHLAKHKQEVEAYEKAVAALQAEAATHQQPLKTNFTDQQFRKLISDEAEKVGLIAKAKGLALPEEFKNGMEIYSQGGAINPRAVALLEWQLQAIKRLVGHAADSGLSSIDDFARDPFPMEDRDWQEKAAEAAKEAEEKAKQDRRNSGRGRGRGGREAEKASTPAVNPMSTGGTVMETYRVVTEVTGSYESLQTFLNRIAADDAYFTWVRRVRIENAKKTSPIPNDVPPPAPLPDWVAPEDAPEAQAPIIDAHILFGNEDMVAKLIIDFVRFKVPEGAPAPAPAVAAPADPVPAPEPAPAEPEPAAPAAGDADAAPAPDAPDGASADAPAPADATATP